MATQGYTVPDATPFARGAQDWEDPEVIVGFYQQVGAGRVAVLGATLAFDHLYKHAITEEIAAELGMSAQVSFSVGIEAEGAVRVAPDGARYTFLSTFVDHPQTTIVSSVGRVRFGGHPITLVPRESRILVEDAVIAGVPVAWATGEFRLHGDQLTLVGSSPLLHVATSATLGFDSGHEVVGSELGNVYAITNPGRPVLVLR
jgi:hypothetical protein